MRTCGQWLNVSVQSLQRKFQNKQTKEDGSHVTKQNKTKNEPHKEHGKVLEVVVQ